jgi:excisionase family DNA binding protein
MLSSGKGGYMQRIDDNETERLTMTVEQAGVALGISRGTTYMLVNTGRLPAIRISDRRIIIPRKAIDDLLASASKQGG